MNSDKHDRAFVIAALATIVMSGALPARSDADSHPQEVLDLVAAYDALAMKVRPLQDRVAIAASPGAGDSGFRPEGVPLRATAGTAATEGRVSERLRHKDRAAPADDDYGRIRARLSTLEAQIKAERARVSDAGFGVRPARADSDAGAVRFGDARRGSRPPSSSPADPAPAPDADAIDEARENLAAMQQEYAALEREVGELERR